MVNGGRKSPLTANSNKALTISNHITNFSDHLRKTEKNMEYVYIVRKFVDLHDPFIERKIFKVSEYRQGGGLIPSSDTRVTPFR